MPGTWWTRVVIVTAALLWGSWMLIPSVVGESASEQLRAQASDAQSAAEDSVLLEDDVDESEVDEPWWSFVVPTSRINLGLDLQGGIDMTLQVEVDEAVVSTVQRDIKPVRDAAANEGVPLVDVRREPGEPVLLIRPDDGVGLEPVRKLMSARFAIYEYLDTRNIEDAEYYAFGVQPDQVIYLGQRAVEQALETLRTRVDETGVKEPAIVLKGGNRINVQLPGMENVEQAVAAIGTTAVLEFMMVDEEVEEATVDRVLIDAERALSPEEYLSDPVLSDWLVREKKIPATDRILWEYGAAKGGGTVRTRPYVVKDEVILTGDDINDAHTAMNQYNEPYVSMEFKPRGARIFADVTAENVGRRFAIVLDRQVRSAPVIREKIGGGRASIEMGVGDYQQALSESSVLSLVLRTGALPAPVTIGEVRTVGASMGADAIQAGLRATAVGSVLVLFFTGIYYRKAGFMADIALVCNVMLVMALLAAAGATLTLPGIAGIALTVGMAVDCNIIVYERIREELRLGKNARSAVDAGFEKALWAVLDANITTFIAGVVLYTYGTGPIKGFAVTLMIGILTTLFTGIFMSRAMLDFLTRKASVRLSI
ncbi:MAG: protein translocase subunit SecD [Myxococcota bacterium]|nr:protein translocase subunit SecD [Myxococcota bacterium]